ncbi:MAG: SdpI family protein [Edaphocola sp.]
MKLKFFRETIMVIFCLVPLAYLASLYNQLPATVPVHFGADGEANGWGTKQSLWLMPGLLPMGMYLLFLLLPAIDPKRKLRAEQGKYVRVRFALTVFMVLLTLFMLRTAQTGRLGGLDKWIFVLLGLFFAVLGNYLPALKPNYFIGVRTPWTLENEDVWRKTHQFAGRLWMVGGLLIAALALVFKASTELVMLPLILALAAVPVIYSYVVWRKTKTQVP